MYGLYVVILGFIGYFFTGSIGRAAAKYIAEYRSSGEIDKISDIVSSTIILTISLSLLATGSVVLFARLIVADIMLISPELQNDAILALYLAAAIILIGTTGQIFQLILQGLQRFDIYLLVTNLTSLLLSIGSVAAVLLGYSVLAILTSTLLVSLVSGIVSFKLALRLLPEFSFTFRIQAEAWRSVWRYSASIIAYQLCGSLLLLFERGWIVRRFGIEALPFYVVPMILATYIHLFTGSLVLALFPAVNELLGEPEKLAELYRKTSKLILILIVFAVLSAIIGGRLFLALWINEAFAESAYWMLVIHVFTFGILAMATAAWLVAESFKFAAINALATFVWLIISIPLMLTLSGSLQEKGVAIGRLIGVLVFIPLIFYVEKRFIGGVMIRFWGMTAIKIILAAIFAIVTEMLILSILQPSWWTFFTSIAAGLAIYTGILSVTGIFEPDEKQLLRNMFVKFR